jgi:hypothetical protein
MTKPHEETWTTGDGALSGALYSGDTWIGSFTDAKRAKLAVQAPEMARVLMEHAGVWAGPNKAFWHTGECWRAREWLTDGSPCTEACGAIRETLRAAGVIQ